MAAATTTTGVKLAPQELTRVLTELNNQLKATKDFEKDEPSLRVRSEELAKRVGSLARTELDTDGGKQLVVAMKLFESDLQEKRAQALLDKVTALQSSLKSATQPLPSPTSVQLQLRGFATAVLSLPTDKSTQAQTLVTRVLEVITEGNIAIAPHLSPSSSSASTRSVSPAHNPVERLAQNPETAQRFVVLAMSKDPALSKELFATAVTRAPKLLQEFLAPSTAPSDPDLSATGLSFRSALSVPPVDGDAIAGSLERRSDSPTRKLTLVPQRSPTEEGGFVLGTGFGNDLEELSLSEAELALNFGGSTAPAPSSSSSSSSTSVAVTPAVPVVHQNAGPSPARASSSSTSSRTSVVRPAELSLASTATHPLLELPNKLMAIRDKLGTQVTLKAISDELGALGHEFTSPVTGPKKSVSIRTHVVLQLFMILNPEGAVSPDFAECAFLGTKGKATAEQRKEAFDRVIMEVCLAGINDSFVKRNQVHTFDLLQQLTKLPGGEQFQKYYDEYTFKHSDSLLQDTTYFSDRAFHYAVGNVETSLKKKWGLLE